MKNLLPRLRARLFRSKPWRAVRRALHSPRLFGERYTVEDNTLVTVYTRQPEQFPVYTPVIDLRQAVHLRRVRVSLVATARNEARTARALYESLLHQTRQPDEIIVVDTGSQDGTPELLRALAAQSPARFTVLSEPGANIARGRNAGIARAAGEVIAITDFGCALNADWLENLIAPFEIDPAVEVSAGRYEAVNRQGQPIRWQSAPPLGEINPQIFLPPGVSLAFAKTAWERAGGFPEWLTLTGEDTYFDLELKQTTTHWAFSPDALVRWEAPGTLPEIWRKAYRWATGDGESGANARAYFWLAVRTSVFMAEGLLWLGLAFWGILAGWALLLVSAAALAAGAALWFGLRWLHGGETLRWQVQTAGTVLAQVLGFLAGAQRSQQASLRRWQKTRGLFFILAGVPIDDTGGGSRGAQIALELIRRGHLVVYVHKFPKYEHADLRLIIRHPNLIHRALKEFSVDLFLREHGALLAARSARALVELPIPDFLPIIEKLRAASVNIIYDLLDDWDTALGGEWYTPETERAVIAASRALVATAPSLAARLGKLSARPVALLPNAVNSYLFNPQRHYPPPADLPAAEWRAIYVGALWGEWFDWELLTRLAQAYPTAAIVVIGDYAGQCPNPPPNLHFLGLKAQRDLPPYLAHSAVAILPWKVNSITQATSPLKVYEYLAMRKPVVAPDILPLRGLPGVTLAADNADFIAQVGAARTRTLPEAELAGFIAQNDWAARVDALLRLI